LVQEALLVRRVQTPELLVVKVAIQHLALLLLLAAVVVALHITQALAPPELLVVLAVVVAHLRPVRLLVVQVIRPLHHQVKAMLVVQAQEAGTLLVVEVAEVQVLLAVTVQVQAWVETAGLVWPHQFLALGCITLAVAAVEQLLSQVKELVVLAVLAAVGLALVLLTGLVRPAPQILEAVLAVLLTLLVALTMLEQQVVQVLLS
jgi:hypothetical protein